MRRRQDEFSMNARKRSTDDGHRTPVQKSNALSSNRPTTSWYLALAFLW